MPFTLSELPGKARCLGRRKEEQACKTLCSVCSARPADSRVALPQLWTFGRIYPAPKFESINSGQSRVAHINSSSLIH
jgi:hypothetical protein